VAGPTPKVTDHPAVVEQFEEGEEIGSLSNQLSSHAVPNSWRTVEERDLCASSLRENATQAVGILSGSR
jgi:hypothetical protein